MKSYKLLDFYFQGQFHEGLMHGKGSYTWADGVTYEVCHSYSICNKNILCQIHLEIFVFLNLISNHCQVFKSFVLMISVALFLCVIYF